jgi:hypothetical protein
VSADALDADPLLSAGRSAFDAACPVPTHFFFLTEPYPDVVASVAAWLATAVVDDLPVLAVKRLRAVALGEWVHHAGLAGTFALDAAEMERRIERRIAELIREGQAEGKVRAQGQSNGERARAITWRAQDFLSRKSLSGARHDGVYAMVDNVPFDVFEKALTAGREEGNLSRANVCRLVRRVSDLPATGRAAEIAAMAADGHTSGQIADHLRVKEEWVRRIARQHDIALPDAVIGPRRRIDPKRVVSELVPALDGLAMSARLVGSGDVDAFDAQQRQEWARSMRSSLRQLSRLAREMGR